MDHFSRDRSELSPKTEISEIIGINFPVSTKNYGPEVFSSKKD